MNPERSRSLSPQVPEQKRTSDRPRGFGQPPNLPGSDALRQLVAELPGSPPTIDSARQQEFNQHTRLGRDKFRDILRRQIQDPSGPSRQSGEHETTSDQASTMGSLPDRLATTHMGKKETKLRVSLSKEMPHLTLNYEEQHPALLTDKSRRLLDGTLTRYQQAISMQIGALRSMPFSQIRDRLEGHIDEFRQMVEVSTLDLEGREHQARNETDALLRHNQAIERQIKECESEKKALQDHVDPLRNPDLAETDLATMLEADLPMLDQRSQDLQKSRRPPEEIQAAQERADTVMAQRIGWETGLKTFERFF